MRSERVRRGPLPDQARGVGHRANDRHRRPESGLDGIQRHPSRDRQDPLRRPDDVTDGGQDLHDLLRFDRENDRLGVRDLSHPGGHVDAERHPERVGRLGARVAHHDLVGGHRARRDDPAHERLAHVADTDDTQSHGPGSAPSPATCRVDRR